MSDKPAQVPLVELARTIPKDLRAEWEIQWAEDGTPTGHSMAPVGRYIHELLDALEAKDKQIDALTQLAQARGIAASEAEARIAELEKALMCCGDARGIEGMEYEHRIAELESRVDMYAEKVCKQQAQRIAELELELAIAKEQAKLAAIEGEDDGV
jgi:hypothetical protein